MWTHVRGVTFVLGYYGSFEARTTVCVCVDVMNASNVVVQDVLAGGAGSAVKFDAGLGSAAPGGESAPLGRLSGQALQKHKVRRSLRLWFPVMVSAVLHKTTNSCCTRCLFN